MIKILKSIFGTLENEVLEFHLLLKSNQNLQKQEFCLSKSFTFELNRKGISHTKLKCVEK